MIKTSSIISLGLIAAFAIFFGIVVTRKGSIEHWGKLTILLFILGLGMSITSGMKDGMGTAGALFANNSLICIILSILGGLAFLVGLVMLFIRKQDFWQVGFYMLSGVIIVKTVMVESARMIHYLSRM